jgi:hypothetical protein
MQKLVETLGITRLSKSQVSVMAKDLDEQVEAFRTRPLDAGPYTFLAADALVLKVREGGRTVNVHALLAVGVNADGYRDPRPARHVRRGRRRLARLLRHARLGSRRPHAGIATSPQVVGMTRRCIRCGRRAVGRAFAANPGHRARRVSVRA